MVENDDALVGKLFDHGYKAKPERVILFTIEAWDVNCSQHITARMTVAEVEGLFGAVQERIGVLQAENARLRAALGRKRYRFLRPCPPGGRPADFGHRLNLFAPRCV